DVPAFGQVAEVARVDPVLGAALVAQRINVLPQRTTSHGHSHVMDSRNSHSGGSPASRVSSASASGARPHGQSTDGNEDTHGRPPRGMRRWNLDAPPLTMRVA